VPTGSPGLGSLSLEGFPLVTDGARLAVVGREGVVAIEFVRWQARVNPTAHGLGDPSVTCTGERLTRRGMSYQL
jgi:hypothetical protein